MKIAFHATFDSGLACFGNLVSEGLFLIVSAIIKKS